MNTDSLIRLPVYSLVAGAITGSVLLTAAMTGYPIPVAGLGALGLLPLSAAIVDAVRSRKGSKPVGDLDPFNKAINDAAEDSDLNEWLEEKAISLASQEQQLQDRAMALQQWMQFPEAMQFDAASADRVPPENQSVATITDPLAKHDRELLALIETKTRDLFQNIKQDSYRRDTPQDNGESIKTFDGARVRADLIALVTDVAAIYRPGETSPLLRTNVEAVSRATGRAALRFLVAVERLPGGLSGYDFQTVYTLVMRAVRTYGMYKTAKPYLDVASGMLFAGRIVSSTNPITLVAWWAASKATTYGASRLGEHVIDQQAVGLIRQMVEIVALEVASIYSPMVRYRDVHWVYGVELVHLASELPLSDRAKLEAMKQLATLNLRDEYGRVSLMRQLANGISSRPATYEPAKSLAADQRTTVAERLELFLLSFVINQSDNRIDAAAIEHWQTSTANRLEIRFRVGEVTASSSEQTENAVWSLAAFVLEHFGDEPDQVIDRLRLAKTWNKVDSNTRTQWIRLLQEEPPYLYHPPELQPDSELCHHFLDDLVHMAATAKKPIVILDSKRTTSQPVPLAVWSGERALRLTGYFLRTDNEALVKRYHDAHAKHVLGSCDQKSVPPTLIAAIEYLANEQTIHAVYCDAMQEDQSVVVAKIESKLVCFSVEQGDDDQLSQLTVHAHCDAKQARIKKIAGYVRSDCQIDFPGGCVVTVPGSSMRGYDNYFASLITP